MCCRKVGVSTMEESVVATSSHSGGVDHGRRWGKKTHQPAVPADAAGARV